MFPLLIKLGTFQGLKVEGYNHLNLLKEQILQQILILKQIKCLKIDQECS
jgi:hypothetical protein